jgi:hypothetical protein
MTTAAVLATAGALVGGAQANLAARPDVAWQRVAMQLLPLRSVAEALPTEEQAVQALQSASRQSSSAVRHAVAQTRRAAQDDPALAQLQALALVRIGDVTAGRAMSDAAFPADPTPAAVMGRADVLRSTGHTRAAVALVSSALATATAQHSLAGPILAEWLTQYAPHADDTSRGSLTPATGQSDDGEEAP